MDASEFERLLIRLRERLVHVRVGLEKPHASSTLAVAELLAGQRADRIARGDRVAYVYKSPEDSDDDYSEAAIIDAEQARRLLAAGAVELGAEKSSPNPASSLSWKPTFPDSASRARAPVIAGGMTSPPPQPDELPGRGPLIDDDVVQPQPVPGSSQPFIHQPLAQPDELPGTTDAKASADQRVGAVAATLGGDIVTATGTVQGSPIAALNQEELVAEDRPTATGVESALNVRSGVGTVAGTSKVTAVGASIAAGTGTAASTSTAQAVAESVQVPGDEPAAAVPAPAVPDVATDREEGHAREELSAATAKRNSSSERLQRLQPQPQASWAERTLLASHASDAAEGKDLLQLDREVDALSSLLVAKNVEPPLSVGLFGEWGSGKSFFMKELHRAIEVKAAGEAEDTFCRKVIQIRFNAWHYVDANLWASLVTTIFEQLRDRDQYKPVFDQLATTQTLRDRVDEKLAAAKERQMQALTSFEQAQRSYEEKLAAALDGVTWTDVAKQGVDQAITDAPRQLGIYVSDIDELSRRIDELGSLGGRVAALWRWGWHGKLSLLLLAFAATVVSALPIVWLNVSWIQEHLRHIGAYVTTGVLVAIGVLGTVLLPFRRIVTNAEALRARIEKIADAKASAAAQEQKRAELALKEAQEAVRALETEKDEFESGRRLFEFIAERAGSGDYSKYLGLIALIHKDFKKLDDLIRSSSTARSDAVSHVDRIILYIDDLDRCGVDHVIGVLQAVHLLLAFRLFVVVVGVDPRWLIHSLKQHYRPLTENQGSDDWKTTPRDYLEKIFQIPFVLRPMGAKGFQNLVFELVRPNAAPAPGPAPQPAVQGNEASAATLAPATADTSPRKSAISLIEISNAERAFMQKLGALIPTPRAAKRFVNMYRLMRAISTDDIVAHDTWRLPMVLLALLIGEPDDAAALYQQIALASDASWLEFAKAHPGRAATKLSSILNKEPALMDTQLADLQQWIPTVSRYSFQCSIPTLA